MKRISVCVLLLVSGHAYAGGDRLEANADAAASVSGDTSLVASPSHSNRAFSVSGSDMDIRDGYRSWSVLFGLIQDTKVNPLTVARNLAAEGHYVAAAMIRCDIGRVAKPLGGKDACIELLSTPPTRPTPPPATSEVNEDDEDEEFYAEHMELVADLQAQVKVLQSEVNKPKPAPRIVERQIVEQAPLLTKQLADELRIK